MITSPDRTTLISSAGWVDHDSIWRFDAPSATAERLPLASGARYLTLHSSGSDKFSIAHHFDGTRFELTVHYFVDNSRRVARAVVSENETTIAGDAAAWQGVPLLYAEYLSFEPWRDFVLLKVLPVAGEVEIQRLEWYDEGYDKGYQGVVGVWKVPGENLAIISVQRDSRLVLHDLETGTKSGTIDLVGRGGNPQLSFADDDREIWASDYDSIVVIDRRNWRVLRSARLQDAAAGCRQFIGDYSFAPDQNVCVVARPFSGDVVGIDTTTLEISSIARCGRQPLEVAALPRGEIVARDWKTGDVLRGNLKRRWFGFK